MSEVKDPKIKLFGKTIELPETSLEAAAEKVGEAAQPSGEDSSIQNPPGSSDSMLEESNCNGDAEDQESNKNESCLNQDGKDEDGAQPLTSEELQDSNTTPVVVEEPKAVSADSDGGPMQSSKTEEEQSEMAGNSQEKTLKKPDKIIPCPRCNSMDTKFCYFNNYNVNQPRHFCKNCQRYWTAGGTMRNVPVGAGRRKNKNAPSQYHRHLTVPEGLQNAHVMRPNAAALITFSSDTPLCESMVSVLNIADKTVQHRPEELHGLKDNGDDHSTGSSTTAASSKEEVGITPNCHPFPPQVACFPGAPWPYPWHSVQWPNFPPPPPAAAAAAGFALPFTAPPYWGCAVPSPWNVPWIIPPTPSQNSGPASPTLGKHSRDDNSLKPVGPEEPCEDDRNHGKCLWVPKTLRIDDPGEAAKSSIWATLGIKNERADSVGGGGLFKAFETQSKGDEKAQAPETSTVLQANPAALSRSLSFQETS